MYSQKGILKEITFVNDVRICHLDRFDDAIDKMNDDHDHPLKIVLKDSY